MGCIIEFFSKETGGTSAFYSIEVYLSIRTGMRSVYTIRSLKEGTIRISRSQAFVIACSMVTHSKQLPHMLLIVFLTHVRANGM